MTRLTIALLPLIAGALVAWLWRASLARQALAAAQASADVIATPEARFRGPRLPVHS